jgi:hypothetical protein
VLDVAAGRHILKNSNIPVVKMGYYFFVVVQIFQGAVVPHWETIILKLKMGHQRTIYI